MNREKKSYIEGIYNYCDRWCEKCKFTSNCLLFSQESRISTYEILHNGDMSNIGEVFQKDIDELMEESEDTGKFEFDEDEDDDIFSDEELDSYENEDDEDERSDIFGKINNPVDDLSNEYFRKAHLLVTALDKKYNLYSSPKEKREDPSFKNIFSSFETFSWFHAFIHVKLKRASWGKKEMEKEDDEEMKEISKYDMDGTAKVAVIGINRSINALNNLYNLLPEFSQEISELLVLLGTILNLAETEFPDYKKFIRPGFDTIQ
jgi:hypothetical protein